MVEAWDNTAVYTLVHGDDADLFADEVTRAHQEGYRPFGENPLVVRPIRDGGVAHWHMLMVKHMQKEGK